MYKKGGIPMVIIRQGNKSGSPWPFLPFLFFFFFGPFDKAMHVNLYLWGIDQVTRYHFFSFSLGFLLIDLIFKTICMGMGYWWVPML